MSWSDPCSNCGDHRADCECGDWNGYDKKRKAEENILNIYQFGSEVYGTFGMNPDQASDADRIIVAKEFYDSGNINHHVFTAEQFQSALDNCDIQALECYFLPDRFVLKRSLNFETVIDKSKLRKAISTIASNSWVKGKKKLIVTGDYDPWLAIKSVFHSLRILDFGTQIAQHGSIINYASMNYLLEDLIKLSKNYQRDELWYAIDIKYRSLFNNKSSIFKQLAPKDLSEKDKKANLVKILEKHGVKNADLVDELIAILG